LLARTIMLSMSSLRSKTRSPECPADYGLPQGERNSFIALDLETANSNISSICQIALVWFVVGEPVNVWHSLVNPGEPFAALNVSLHGIDATAVQDAPSFKDIMRTVAALLEGRVVASHMPFDRIAIERACSQHCIPPLTCLWIDTARVARRAWPGSPKGGMGSGLWRRGTASTFATMTQSKMPPPPVAFSPMQWRNPALAWRDG
jgi:DNA polymerase III epsilon subunit-like protein